MAVTFAQKEKVSKPKKDLLKPQEKPEVAVKVDALFKLNKELQPFRPLEKEFDQNKKWLADFVATDPSLDPAQPVTLIGEEGQVVFSAAAAAMEVVDMQGLIGTLKEKIGYDGLLKLIKLNVTDVKKYLSENELEPFYKKVPGSRKLQSITKLGE